MATARYTSESRSARFLAKSQTSNERSSTFSICVRVWFIPWGLTILLLKENNSMNTLYSIEYLYDPMGSTEERGRVWVR